MQMNLNPRSYDEGAFKGQGVPSFWFGIFVYIAGNVKQDFTQPVAVFGAVYFDSRAREVPALL